MKIGIETIDSCFGDCGVNLQDAKITVNDRLSGLGKITINGERICDTTDLKKIRDTGKYVITIRLYDDAFLSKVSASREVIEP